MVESEVRRNPGIMELNEGYKNHVWCTNKNCLSCSAAPPCTNTKIVKKICYFSLQSLKKEPGE
jgi:hypothetical protein